jgi:hypothetical protein
MGLDAVVIAFPKHASGSALRSSFSVGDEPLILRILAVLNAEMERSELGYETRARLYFYLGFQRYAMLRWLSLLPAHEHDRAWEGRRCISRILQLLTSPSVLEHEAIDEQMYRDTVIALSGEMFALLRLARGQIKDCGLGAVHDGGWARCHAAASTHQLPAC